MSGKDCFDKTRAMISVIIPVYNSERYIRECVESVLAQSFTYMEILLIDDGSRDKSKEICKAMCREDPRIRLITGKHSGVSAARNTGIEEARGKYLFFLDSDDRIHPKLLEELQDQAEAYAFDAVFCDYTEYPRLNEVKGKCGWEIGKKSDAEEWFHIKHLKQLSCIGGKMLRRDFIGVQRFDRDLVYGEDTVFLYYLVRKGMRMAYLDKEWYYYRKHPESVTYLAEGSAGGQNFKAIRIIRDSEAQRGQSFWAEEWECRLVWKILTEYLLAKNKKDVQNSRVMKRMMSEEQKQPLFKKLSAGRKILFYLLFWGCTYFPPVRRLWMMKREAGSRTWRI